MHNYIESMKSFQTKLGVPSEFEAVSYGANSHSVLLLLCKCYNYFKCKKLK